jgi:hypothetical protein
MRQRAPSAAPAATARHGMHIQLAPGPGDVYQAPCSPPPHILRFDYPGTLTVHDRTAVVVRRWVSATPTVTETKMVTLNLMCAQALGAIYDMRQYAPLRASAVVNFQPISGTAPQTPPRHLLC